MADRTILRINWVSIIPVAAREYSVNVIGVREEHVHQIVPRFVPNTHGGRTVNQDHKWYEITVTLDSDTDIFDTEWDILDDNAAMNDFWIEFALTPSVAVIDTPPAYASCAVVAAAGTLTAVGGDPYWIFEPGDDIVITNSTNGNDGTYVINTVTPLVITTVGALAGGNTGADVTIRIARGTTETWTYADTYLTDRREGKIDTDQERDTVEYEFISISTKTIHITDGAYAP